MSNTSSRGWRLFNIHSRSHYYVDGVSLCGRLTINPDAKLYDDMHQSNHNCAICSKKRDRLYGCSIPT